ncbi:gas vesicle protein [Streptomyces sp. NPDC047130]|uniref:gas vesicle protein n=1 Tax=Streptomyces sp. NPDC047130 TaxID=3155261 RepID=UPI0033C46FDB
MNEEQPRLPARQAGGSPGAAERWPGSFGAPPRSAANARALEPRRDGEGSLAHVVETLLDKGLVLNADIMVSVAGVELLGIRLRAALASFETASRYGLEFPAGTDTDTAAWRETREEKETCPQCSKKVPTKQLLEDWCPWCGWRSAQALSARDTDGTADGGEGGDGTDDDGARQLEQAPRSTSPRRTTRTRTTAARKKDGGDDGEPEKEKEKTPRSTSTRRTTRTTRTRTARKKEEETE